mmetsp:Transcript_8168/g.9584  ORF Transcript_8168/g.9584 Transcript_8168/m.9584 type:complete len:81 (+) Transcript_8168:1148-1390(+)
MELHGSPIDFGGCGGTHAESEESEGARIVPTDETDTRVGGDVDDFNPTNGGDREQAAALRAAVHKGQLYFLTAGLQLVHC